MQWTVCLLLIGAVFAERGIRNVINVGSDDVPYDSCAVSVAYNEDTRLEIFVLGNDGLVWHRAQPNYTSPANEWTPWESLPTESTKDGAVVVKDGPTIIRDAEGHLVVFTRTVSNKLVYTRQTKINGGAYDWAKWEVLAGEPNSRPSVLLNSEGLIHIFVRSRDNTLHHLSQFIEQKDSEAVISWGDWEDLGGSLSGAPTAIVDSEGLVHIYGRAVDRSLFHLTQIPKAEYMSWGTWKTMGGTLASNPRVPLLNNDANLLEVVVRGSDKAFWFKSQVSNHRDTVAWSKWGSLGGVFASGPATVVNPDGLLGIFGRGVDKHVYERHQYLNANGTSWSDWSDFGGITTTAPEIARRPDGTLVLFARNPEKSITMKFQTQDAANFDLKWSDEWFNLGGLTKTFEC